MKYRSEIDGLRAVAVIPVVLFHAGFPFFHGGFVGVDIFFVISGYLITTIILAEKTAGGFTLIDFYERRARRILPALFFMMLCCLPLAWFWLLPTAMKSFAQSIVGVIGFSSNILFYLTTNYFDTSSELKPLLHTWSLAVEEQYYVFFPLFCMTAWKLGRRRMAALLLLLAGASLLLAQCVVDTQPAFSFFLLPTRAWEILIGALLAFYMFERQPRPSDLVSQLGGLTGLFLIIISVAAYDKNTPFPSLYTLLPTIGAALIILYANSHTLAGKILGAKFMVGVGMISYSMYLWHQPLLAFARHRLLDEPSIYLTSALALLSAGLGYLSWKYIERPFRDKRTFDRRRIFGYAAAGSTIFVAIGLAGALSKGYPARLPERMDSLADIDIPKIDNGWCFYSIDSIPSLQVGDRGTQCYLGNKNSPVKGVLFGDSFAGQYEPFWATLAESSGAAIQSITTNWCYPSLGKQFNGPLGSRAYQQCLHNRSYITRNMDQYDFVVLSGEWANVQRQGRMQEVSELIALAASKTKLVIVMPSPKIFDRNVGDVYKKSILFNLKFDINSIPAQRDQLAREANDALRRQAALYRNVRFIERDTIFQSHGRPSDLSTDMVPFSYDGGHISIHGSKSAAAQFSALPEGRKLIAAIHHVRDARGNLADAAP